MLTDTDLLRLAVNFKHSDTKLAQYLARTPAAISQWRKAGRLPVLVRRLLLLEMGLQEIKGAPWMAREFQNLRAATKAAEQVFLLWHRCHEGKTKEWEKFVRLLDKLQPWTTSDWKRIFDGNLDWIATRERILTQHAHVEARRARRRTTRPVPVDPPTAPGGAAPPSSKRLRRTRGGNAPTTRAAAC